MKSSDRTTFAYGFRTDVFCWRVGWARVKVSMRMDATCCWILDTDAGLSFWAVECMVLERSERILIVESSMIV